MVDYFEVGAISVGLGGPLLGDAAAGGSLTQLRDRARRFPEAAALWREG